jgi:hypothetical protein
VQAVWRLGASTRLTASWGLHTQSPGFEKVLLGDAFLDFGGRGRLRVAGERARRAVLGLEQALGRRAAARLELYDTRFDRLIVGRRQTEGEWLAEQRGKPVGTPFSPEPLITSVPVNDGRGTARGAELSLALDAMGPSGRGIAGRLSYTYARARRESYGRVYPFDYDRRHAVAASVSLRPIRHLGLAATWQAASGLPYTPFQPTLVVLVLHSDAVIADGTPLTHEPGLRFSGINAARHPFYSRLDLRASLGPGGAAGRWEVYVDVFNVLKHNLVDGNNGPSFRPTLTYDGDWSVVERSGRGRVIPSFGLRLRF